MDMHGVHAPLFHKLDLIIGGQTSGGHDLFLDLRGEHIHPAQDDHIVRTPCDFFNPSHATRGARQ